MTTIELQEAHNILQTLNNTVGRICYNASHDYFNFIKGDIVECEIFISDLENIGVYLPNGMKNKLTYLDECIDALMINIHNIKVCGFNLSDFLPKEGD